VFAGKVGVAAQRVKNQDGVGVFGIELSPRLISESVGRKSPAAIEREDIAGRVDSVEKCALWIQSTPEYNSPALLEP
jgi:hypothetical protein